MKRSLFKKLAAAALAVSLSIAVTACGETKKDDSTKSNAAGSSSSSTKSNLEKAPDFTLEDLEGNKVSLSDFKGKKVFLNFWSTFCESCTEELGAIETLSKELKDKDTVILALHYGQTKDTIKSFMDENSYTFKALLDTDMAVAGKYGVSVLPVSVFIDKDGNITAKKPMPLSIDDMKKSLDAIK